MLDLQYERQHGWPGRRVAGVDEAGRGAWAGPVVAAAVVCPPDLRLGGKWADLRDSKKLSPEQRTDLSGHIRTYCSWAVGVASVQEIDKHNILEASLLAMGRAVAGLGQGAQLVLVDGHVCPNIAQPAQAIVKGDDKVFSIAAASVIAKTHRDDLMAKLAQQHPAYGWAQNKGYGTRGHQHGLAQAGVSPQHRRSFAPVRQILCGKT